jgi:GNAT superfamily N-acetyltransferase
LSAYRFCRTDDIGLLVDALNRCWAPYFPDEPPATAASFKRSIRDLQVWCSSCMVAFAGADPVGVLIGAKRPSGTLIQKIAVHPDHRRQGHGRHLLTSLGSKLAILGPPRIIAEVPESLAAASALFRACGFVDEARLTDYVYPTGGAGSYKPGGAGSYTLGGAGSYTLGGAGSLDPAIAPDRLVIPITIDDLDANGLLTDLPDTCWERSVQTLTARKAEIEGIAVASDERIEAYLLYTSLGEILGLRSFVEDGGARLAHLLSRIPAGSRRFSKVHTAEISPTLLETLGFRPTAGVHYLYATTARSA